MDIYFKKEINYLFGKQEFKFDIAGTLFSTFAIDHGTDILIRAIKFENPKRILDIGCGYGPIGIILAKNNSEAEVVLVDRDLLAVRYARHNAEKNGLNNVTVLGSLGIEAVKDKTFDLIVSNIPAKLGDEAISMEFILDPYRLLNPGGEYWTVVVSALNRLIPKVCALNKIKVKEIRKRHGHTVYKINKPA